VVHLSAPYDHSDRTRLERLARRQHGVVSWEQLRALGYTTQVVRRMVAKGWLHRLSRGVYAVGHTRLTLRGRYVAAVLACGEGAVLSHGDAAALHNLSRAPAGDIHVTAPQQRRLPGVRCHRARTLDPGDITIIDAIPVTTVARTLLDRAEQLSAQRLRTLLETALRQQVFDLVAIQATIARNPGRHGIAPLTEALSRLTDVAPWTQSELERAMLELIRDAGLPEPQVNVVVDGDVVDFFWPHHNLVVEVDGWDTHRGRAAFTADRRRDANHTTAGRRVARFVHDDVANRAPTVSAQLSAMLAEASDR
jgi:very-short-patch-repair endonuclease